ncbi:MAG: HAMP domain-containing histidine kinase [Fusobacterium sp.]|nr:HAMP domain-containing histidine kinase [Fusobacterium sp.]
MNILKEKDLYDFLKNLNMKTGLKDALACMTDFLRSDAEAAWVLLINPKTNKPLLRVGSKNHARVAQINKLVLDYFGNGFEQDDIIEFIYSISGGDTVIEPVFFAGNLQGILGVIGQDKDFVRLVLECASQKLENFSLKEENERTFKERMEFLASISHEFKTPLNSIIGFSDIMQAKNSDPALAKYIKNISNSSKFLLGLILDVLDLSRSQTKEMELQYERFSPKSVILETLGTLENQIKEKNIEVRYTLMEMYIDADLRRFRQLVLNLISNAVKFNKINGKITIVTYMNEKREFVFEIKDTGDGISKKDCGKIFKFFSQVNQDQLKRQQGSGVGLFLCKTIVDAHKGKIDFKSRLNYGSTFWFTIPV